MGRRSFAVNMPANLKAWLDQELVRRGFQDYEQLADALNDQGVKTSSTAVHLYGQKLQRRIESIQRSTEAAQLIAETSPDEADARSAAVISMVQSDMFDVLVTLQEAETADPAKRVKLLSQAARSIAELSRASVSQKKWAQEVNAKLNAAKAKAANEAEAVARKAGMSDDDWGLIRAKFLGIEVD